MRSFLVDGRVYDIVRNLLPEGELLEPFEADATPTSSAYPLNHSYVGAVSLAGDSGALKKALAGSSFDRIPVIEMDPADPISGARQLMHVMQEELTALRRQLGESRRASAQLRNETMQLNIRLRELERLLYDLGNPQFFKALAWQPTGAMAVLMPAETLTQRLPVNAVSLSSIDLWFPQTVMPVIEALSVSITDASGLTHLAEVQRPEMGIETGWLRFVLPELIEGVGRDCTLVLTWRGENPLEVGLAQPVADVRFRATSSAAQPHEHTLAVQVWHALGGVRLPTPAPLLSGRASLTTRDATFIASSALPHPSLISVPTSAKDHVTTAYWSREQVIMVHPSRQGAVCAIVRDIPFPNLTHISALINVGHPRSPSLNFAIGVAPAGAVDNDGLWHRRLGPWVTGMPAHSWGQAHCLPLEPLGETFDLLLAVSIAGDVPNDMSWGFFRGFRFATGDSLG
ncbi:DUF6212 domain-containing protein [Ketogulonicigenium vulgare]|uniref:DUF6212 domain-containing protein n=1 Tax=Ketogulonicigenium vulgare TaxID=92945 RepID=UPI0001E66B55|nr:DUF6212 domain-containing protein [Ketogulonicigenium vulgare]ADO42967.1 membrane-anchored protein [Ketogulonicigenium vulgare Y25]ALJ81292.1 hypothetical protein KVH_08920 [Ketogulonicigenium vulgare]ANW34030.1 hypothetical protein KvSKV_08890 [Ketogulonicigenium vulgare]AOZ54877.1 membrane-anchored protein [Ketogulonicigenium vulgare]